MIKTLIAFLALAFATPTANAAEPDAPEIRMQNDDDNSTIDQTRLHDPVNGVAGNCVQAAIASLLRVPIEHVPDVSNGVICETPEQVNGFWSRFDAVFEGFGLATVRMAGNYGFPGYHLAAGLSPRGTSHMVVRQGFDVVHDPHPSRDGLAEVTSVYILAPRIIGLWEMREAGAGYANAEDYAPETPEDARARAKGVVARLQGLDSPERLS